MVAGPLESQDTSPPQVHAPGTRASGLTSLFQLLEVLNLKSELKSIYKLNFP